MRLCSLNAATRHLPHCWARIQPEKLLMIKPAVPDSLAHRGCGCLCLLSYVALKAGLRPARWVGVFERYLKERGVLSRS